MEDFYRIDERFYILVNNQEIEVNESMYKQCKNIDNNTKYLDKKYNKWNMSFDCDTLISHKFEYTDFKSKLDIAESFALKDEIKERLKKLNQTDKVIAKRLLEGYSESEIATELSISRQYINKRKNRIREVF